jgi:EF hand
MKFAKPLLVASALALAFGAYAADDKQARAKDPEPGFNNLDANNDGKLTRAEAAKDKSLLGKWKEADRDNDGTLSRAEYLIVKGKKDIGAVAEKVQDAVSSDDKSSSAGATKKSK